MHGYFIDYRLKTEPCARSTEALVPVDLAQLALGWWERKLAGDVGADEHFRQICRLLTDDAESFGDELRWPYRVSLPKYRLEPPWYSAMAQGQIASVFVREHLSTGDDRCRSLALRAVQPLLSTTNREFVTLTENGPILEELSSQPPSHILNGWIFALWGLWEVHVALDDAGAGSMFAASLDCLRRMLNRYDVGWWTKYSLYPHSIPDLAKPFYHRLHIDQAEILYRLTGFPEFHQAARRWRGYDSTLARAAAVAYKVPFVLSSPRSYW